MCLKVHGILSLETSSVFGLCGDVLRSNHVVSLVVSAVDFSVATANVFAKGLAGFHIYVSYECAMSAVWADGFLSVSCAAFQSISV